MIDIEKKFTLIYDSFNKSPCFKEFLDYFKSFWIPLAKFWNYNDKIFCKNRTN